jgi:sulfhydrogenase subunit beta (sulfur reductase)
MKDVEYVVLMKEDFSDFISRLSKLQKLIAPVPKGYNNFSFKEVSSADEISLKYIPTVLPPKKFFMPQHESLIEFSTAKGFDVTPVVECEKMTIFGVHTCDLAGIQCLNMVFSVRPRDYNYLTRKRMIDIIGLECNEYCDEYASCCLVSSHLPSGGYDMFFTDMGDYFIAHVNTQAGERMVETTKVFGQAENSHLDALKEVRERKRTIFKNEVPIEARFIPAMFDRSFESRVWKELEERCLACGNCTNVCPTCYCFDIVDEINLDLKTGRRYRKWDSCQLEPFAKVAGGENFRKERSARQRHRYYRKFRYPVSKYARLFCTGCGRCTRTCMAKISLKETLNSLIKEMDTAIWKKWL